MADTPSRKLVVILHADVVGSTRLVHKDETLAHQRIQNAFHRLSKTTASYGGTAQEIRGDALVAEFSRASDAVSAALAFQSENTEHNSKLDDDIRPEVRVGISLGEVVIADGTVTGPGVVLAQRLEQLAESGGVVVQGSVSETVPTRLPYEFESLGEQRLKGFDQPVRAFAARLKAGAEVAGPELTTADTSHRESVTDFAEDLPPLELPDKPSIAVLPFTNMSGDPEQEYFSDGISENIITALSKLSKVLVIARHSSFIYKGTSVDVKQVGRDQGVRYVLEGSVRKGGSRMRITAQLVDTTTGHHLWAEHYDREVEDIFAVQDEITSRVTIALQIRLTEGEQARIWAGETENLEAWEFLARGVQIFVRHHKGDPKEARRLFEEAINLDPGYATAISMLARTYADEVLQGWSDDRAHSIDRAFELGQEAVTLDAACPDPYSLLGILHLLKGEHSQAVAMCEKAVALAQSHSFLAAQLAMVLSYSGEPERAVEMMKRAMRLCPIYPPWYLVALGRARRLLNQYEEAISAYREAIQRDPESVSALVHLAGFLAERGHDLEAKSIATKVLSIEPEFSIHRHWAVGYKDPMLTEREIASLRRVGLPE